MPDLTETNVFQRTATEGAIIGAAAYNLVIGLVLLWGFGVNWLIVQNIPPATIASVNIWVFFIGYFASCFLGVYLFNKSSNPVVSFIGYNLVVVPFGLIVNLVVSQYEPSLVVEAIQLTGMVTLGMMVLGSLFPAFFQSIMGALSIGLIVVILVECFQIFFLHRESPWLDYVVVLIFCGYIGYDWGRANQIPKTVDNAIDSAAAIYMDMINLFLRILRILGRRK